MHTVDICVAGLALYLVYRLVRKRTTPLPPGPSGWPLIGNLLNFPTYAPYKVFGAMSRKYGPIISYNMMGKRYVVLNSFKAAKDILDKKSAITSDRLHYTMAGDLVGGNNMTVFQQYGDTCRRHRKFFHQQIGTKNSLRTFYPTEEAEAKQLVRDVLKKPDDLLAHCRKMAGSVILRISHGYSVQGDDDPLVELADKVMESLADIVTPGRYLVDTIPILRFLPEWFPGGGFHKNVKQWRETVSEAATKPYNFVLDNLANDNAVPSFTSRLLQEGATPEDERVLKYASFSMYLGGSDTTPATVSAFFLAMAIYPEVFRKAQQEVDAVIGSDRLPTIQDRDDLPYVNALCKELLRWNVVTPLASHVASEDIIYEGYLIPKGTCILGNIWYILSDPEMYPDPDVFSPERFLGEDQQIDPREVCFGWGRRSCPGSHLAELCVENGMELVPKYDVKEGMVRHMKPFKCMIMPRSQKAEELLYA